MMKSLFCFAILTLATLLSGKPATAGGANVEKVAVRASSGGSYRFDVTVRHGDEGWQHYADAFEIVTPDGKVLGTRILYHPHVNEQPFTRSLTGVRIPAGITEVVIRARDKPHGFGGKDKKVKLPGR